MIANRLSIMCGEIQLFSNILCYNILFFWAKPFILCLHFPACRCWACFPFSASSCCFCRAVFSSRIICILCTCHLFTVASSVQTSSFLLLLICLLGRLVLVPYPLCYCLLWHWLSSCHHLHLCHFLYYLFVVWFYLRVIIILFRYLVIRWTIGLVVRLFALLTWIRIRSKRNHLFCRCSLYYSTKNELWMKWLSR